MGLRTGRKNEIAYQGITYVKVVGGGAKSPVWLQTMANVLNVSVEKWKE